MAKSKSYRDIIRDIRQGKLHAVYFLAGEEDFFTKKIENALLEHVVAEEAKGFDQAVYYAQDVSLQDLLMRASQFPMMGERQLLVVRNAENYFKNAKDLEAIKQYVSHLPSQTVLSLRYHGKPGAKIKKALSGEGVLYYESPRIYDNQIPGFIEDLLKYHGFSADTKAVYMLSEHVGSDLSRMEKEIEKLSVVLESGTKITPDIVEKYIGISKDFNIFEFKSAIAQGDFARAYKIARFFSQNPKEYSLYAIVAVLYGFFAQLYKYWTLPDKHDRSRVASALKINPYFVPEYQKAARYYPMKKISKVMQVLRDTDLKVKGLGAGRAEYKDLINEMIYKIMH